MAGQGGAGLDLKDGLLSFFRGHCAFRNNVDTEPVQRLSWFEHPVEEAQNERVFFGVFPYRMAFLLSGCNRATPEGFVDLDCGSEAGKTFEGWSSWTKVNPTPILSEGHSDSYVDVYVDDLAKTTYLAASTPYPECARIVKAKHKDETATEVVGLTIMVKMPAGYDPGNNDWWYGKYDAKGTRAILSAGKRSDCIECHRQAADTDYLFSEEVVAASNE